MFSCDRFDRIGASPQPCWASVALQTQSCPWDQFPSFLKSNIARCGKGGRRTAMSSKGNQVRRGGGVPVTRSGSSPQLKRPSVSTSRPRATTTYKGLWERQKESKGKDTVFKVYPSTLRSTKHERRCRPDDAAKLTGGSLLSTRTPPTAQGQPMVQEVLPKSGLIFSEKHKPSEVSKVTRREREREKERRGRQMARA